jgi:hypothetical protein
LAHPTKISFDQSYAKAQKLGLNRFFAGKAIGRPKSGTKNSFGKTSNQPIDSRNNMTDRHTVYENL